MRRSWFLILAALCVAPVLGQPRWERIGGAKGATFEIDRASVIKTEDQAVEAWFRSSLPKPMTLKDGRTYQSVATLYRIECEALRTGLAKVVMYAGPSFAQHVGSSSGEVTMERVVPGSAGAAMLDAACRIARDRTSSLFGLGETQEGTYQLDTSTVRGKGTKAASGWVILVPAASSSARSLGAHHMAIHFLVDCTSGVLQPVAWKAFGADGSLKAEGVHGKEKARKALSDSMDERIAHHICH